MSDSKEFSLIWDYIVCPVRDVVLSECDPSFAETVGLKYHESDEWREKVEKAFHHYRHNFKEECYDKRRTEIGDPLLDGRKVGAVLCQTFLKCKVFRFNLTAAENIARRKKNDLSDLEYTAWAANNTLINYKFAYLVSQSLVYLTLLSDLMKDEMTKKMGKRLNEEGHLFYYPTAEKFDSMSTNVIVGLARDDVKGKDLNMLIYAMLLYQSEMYTRECLKSISRNQR